MNFLQQARASLKYSAKFFDLCFLSLGLVALTSCVVGPTYCKPDAAQLSPAKWRWELAEPKDQLAKGAWWSVFHDPVLENLETNAIAGNQNLRAAVARVDQARASARLTRSQFFPELSLDPAVSRQRVSGNEPIPFPFKLKPVYLSTFNVPLDLSYEVDLWGRVRRSFESSRAQAQASAADYQNVLLTLASDVAVNYFILRSLDAEIALLQRTIELREQSVEILKGRFTAGAIGELDVAQAKTELASSRGDLADTERQRAETIDALALLSGQPASAFAVAKEALPADPPAVPIGLPSTVLERRPDVAAAERRLASKNAQIGVARAAYFPVVYLTGQAGFLSGDAGKLFTGDSFTWSLGPSVSFPVFTAGRTAATVKQAESSYQETLANYRQTAFTAFKEVEDSLAQIRFWSQQAGAQAEALESARHVTELTRARYQAGVLTYFEVVNAQRDELQIQRQEAQLTASRFAATVRLIKSLGGGWEQAGNNRSLLQSPADLKN